MFDDPNTFRDDGLINERGDELFSLFISASLIDFKEVFVGPTKNKITKHNIEDGDFEKILLNLGSLSAVQCVQTFPKK